MEKIEDILTDIPVCGCDSCGPTYLSGLRRAQLAGIDAAIKICGENDSAERAANDLRDLRTHLSGQV